MGIPNDPETTPDEWARHRLSVKRCRGAVCFAVVARHFGTWSPKALEKLIDDCAYVTKNGDKSCSGKYRAWYRDGVRPSDGVIEHIREHFGNSVALRFWRDLMLWELLEPEPPTIDRLHVFIESMPRSIHRIMYGPELPWQTRFQHCDVDYKSVVALSKLRSLDAFLTLLCLARKGEILGEDPRHYQAALGAHDVLPSVLYTYAPLRHRWEELYACLERVFWRRSYTAKWIRNFTLDRARSNLASLLADPSAKLDLHCVKSKTDVALDPAMTESHFERAKVYFAEKWAERDAEELLQSRADGVSLT